MPSNRASLLYLAAVLAGFAALYWFRLRKLPLLNQAIVLVALEVTLPYLSYEYTLVHLYPVWALFVLFLARDVAEGRPRIPVAAAELIFSSFALLFGPAPALFLEHSVGGQVQACLLLLLALTVTCVPMPSSLFGEQPAPADLEPEAAPF